ncbi:MAG: hypothetical protein OK455_11465 [Thaumarchaeota archaeon]|nr:hypothetical protein [Nitrososphaerota archaeon]
MQPSLGRKSRQTTLIPRWYSIQALLVAVANVSRLLWTDKRGNAERGRELRKRLSIGDNHPFKSRHEKRVRALRPETGLVDRLGRTRLSSTSDSSDRKPTEVVAVTTHPDHGKTDSRPLITAYSDHICPFCFISSFSVRKLQKEFDITVDWKMISFIQIFLWAE